MFDYSRTVVQVPGIIDSILSKKGGGGDALDMFPLAGALHRTQSLLRVAHNQPFFIGVAGESFKISFVYIYVPRGTLGGETGSFCWVVYCKCLKVPRQVETGLMPVAGIRQGGLRVGKRQSATISCNDCMISALLCSARTASTGG